MKSLLALLVLFVCLIPGFCSAAPFLACDPSQEVIALVEVEITKGSTVQTIPGSYVVRGNDILILDLKNLSEAGAYRFRVRLARSDGWYSAWSPFRDAPGPATGPGNVRVVP